MKLKLSQFPELVDSELKIFQISAIKSLEASLFASRPKALIQICNGYARTVTAFTVAHRFLNTES
ncbi:type III restriction protein res subunit [Candidatus Mycoplasma haematolamae str. Purdue]|uniref:Type III restriction protein res subunit n=1 Tax=Mycoplasma haematolamae (strain Purdue) TaxID=1212765 RepID=I7C6L2_MYCHA|nr:type III restriction protein res subunit [Candidatus Mycoplasma haematolamae str. Purdue]